MSHKSIHTSTLGYAILGLLRKQPGSGYEIRKVFDTPMLRRFSSSPGSIYPALKRLQQLRLVSHIGAARRGQFAITVRGRNALIGWLRTPIAERDVEEAMDLLLLRFAFMEELLALSERRQFLQELASAVDRLLMSLVESRATVASYMPLHGRLALDHQIAIAEANKAWVAAAMSELGPL